MPGFPWARMDTGMPSHPKVLYLLADPAAPKATRWQAMTSIQFAVYWSAGQGTDGHIPASALPFVHGTPATAALAVKHGFWHVDPDRGGWTIHNYDQRQQLTLVSDIVREKKRKGSEKGNCRRWHGPECWVDDRCSRDDAGTG